MLRQDPELAAPAFVGRLQHRRRPSGGSSRCSPACRRSRRIRRALRRSLDELLARTHAALGRHGGELERFGPEGFIATFGADAPRDDDAMRAVRAARELRASRPGSRPERSSPAPRPSSRARRGSRATAASVSTCARSSSCATRSRSRKRATPSCSSSSIRPRKDARGASTCRWSAVTTSSSGC